MQTTWWAQHEYVATWSSAVFSGVCAVIAFVASLKQAKSEGVPVNWNAVAVRVGFFLCLGGLLSPALKDVHGAMAMLVSIMLFAFIRSGV